MALFSWKKSGAGGSGTGQGKSGGDGSGGPPAGTSGPRDGDSGGDSGGGFEPSPEKAKRWFDYAKTAAESSNFEYALTCYANGIKLYPESMPAHEAMSDVAIKYMNAGGKPATGAEIRQIEEGTPVSKFAAAEFAWMKEYLNPSLAIRGLEAAIKANQLEFGNWVATRILNIVRRQKKVSKRQLVQLKDLFVEVRAWNEAMAAGQLAVQLDPTDAALANEIKDLSAQRAMDQGGYERAAGQEGGFRNFVKDAEKQRELQDSETIAGSQSTEERNLLRAKEQYEKNPRQPDSINQYAQLIKKQGTPQAEKQAFDIYMKGFQETGEYRFRMAAGDIKIEQLRREITTLEKKIQQDGEGGQASPQLDSARSRLLELETSEVMERVAKYPTDRTLKLRLGELEFGRGKYDEAIAQLQQAKEEPKLRVRTGHLLGKCFAAEGWHPEAVQEFKEALGAIDATEKERELAIRYDLMVSLIDLARMERASNLAKEALDICSGIARKDITYRDIRVKRKEIDQVLRELSGTDAPG